MKKVLSRITVALLILIFAAIVVCFYLDKFSYAYGLILVLFCVFFGAGQIYQLKNEEYMFKKSNEYRRNDDYSKYTD